MEETKMKSLFPMILADNLKGQKTIENSVNPELNFETKDNKYKKSMDNKNSKLKYEDYSSLKKTENNLKLPVFIAYRKLKKYTN